MFEKNTLQKTKEFFMEILATIFEIGMTICFGASWPFNIIRSYKARTAKGTSILFTLLIAIGYVSAIIGKFLTISTWWGNDIAKMIAFFFYWINLAMVSTGIAIYFRNVKLDKAKEENKDEE